MKSLAFKCIVIIILSAKGLSYAQSQDSVRVKIHEEVVPDEPVAEQHPDSANLIKFSGFAEMDHITFFRQKNAGKIYSRNQGLLHVNLSSSIKNKASLFSSVEIREDLSNKARNRLFLREAYMNIFLNNLDVRVGKQIITWGTADAINFTNNINPVDYSDFLDTRYQTIGVFSLKMDYYIKNWKVQGILIPVFNASILPAMNSPWMEDFPKLIPNPQVPGNYFKTSFSYTDPVLPPKDLRSAQYALRTSTTIGGWDASLSYYKGYNDIPTTFNQIANVINADSIQMFIQPEHRRWQVIGADFSSSIGSLGIRGEGAYIMNEQKSGSAKINPYLQYIVGIDRNFSNIFNNNLFVILQWIHEVTTEKQKFSSKDLNHLFQKSILLRGELEIGGGSKLSLQGIYNMIPKDYYIRPEFTFNIVEGLNLTALADILGGNARGFFGTFKDNKRIQVWLKYNF